MEASAGPLLLRAEKTAVKLSVSNNRRAPMRIILVLAAVAFVLAGCNANQSLNASGPRNLSEIYPGYNAYDPSKYAQTSGFYAGR
jgi:hypothetical protein